MDNTYDAVPEEGYTVSEAAKILDITPGALRKRIRRGTIPASKVDGEWRILIQDEATHSNVEDSGAGQGVSQDVALDVARQQLETFRDAFVMPLVDRIGELEREQGVLTERTRQLEVRNQQLLEEIEELKKPVEVIEMPATAEPEPADEPEPEIEPERKRSWWDRLLGA